MASTHDAAGQAEARRKLLEKLANADVYIFDRDLRVTFATGVVISPPKFAAEALIGKSLSEVIAPAAYADVEGCVQAAFDGCESNCAINYPTGETIEVHVLPLHTADGDVGQVMLTAFNPQVGERALLYSIMHDTTERKQAEDALRQSEAALERSQAIAHVGHWIWDAPTNTVTWSDEMKRIFGLDPETFAGDLNAVLERAIHLGDVEQAPAVEAAAVYAQPDVTEYRLLWPDGSAHYVRATPGDRTLDAAGNIVQLSGVVQDITAHKRTQVMQGHLHRQERLAAVGQLAAGIAHDFNNIMSVILIYTELLSQAAELTEKHLGHALTIKDQTLRATRMIRQILDFSRRSALERQPFDLLPLLKEQEKLLKQTLPEDIEVKLVYEPREYFVFADPTRINQLVVNLAINARDAMPNGGMLHIELAHVDIHADDPTALHAINPGLWVCLSVRDTGTGIAPEHMARIFEPFFTTKGHGGGTGLGLAQAHGIVAQHDGHIFVTSKPGVGTTFTIYLPELTLKGETLAVTAFDNPMALGHGESILVVEDYSAARSSLIELLESWNYHVVEAANGAIALAYLTQPDVKVDVILSDVIMPQMGGYALVKSLRQQGIWTPVIFMSGHTKGEALTGLKDLGVHAWLDKPIGSWQIAKALTNVLQDVAAGRIKR